TPGRLVTHLYPVTKLHSGLGKLADNGPALGRGDAGPAKRGPQFGQGNVPLAASALDQLVHSSTGRLMATLTRPCGHTPGHRGTSLRGRVRRAGSGHRACTRSPGRCGPLRLLL